MDFNRAEPTCYRTNFPYASSGYFVHNTTRNAAYVHQRLSSVFKLCQLSRLKKTQAVSLGITSPQSAQNICCPHEESLGPLLPTERGAETLINPGRCQD